MPHALDFDGDGPTSKHRLRAGRFESKGDVVAQKGRARTVASATRHRNIAILDVETDPFNNETCEPIYPFLAVVYSDQFPTITIWDNDWRSLIKRLFDELEKLDEVFTIYAHNGGRFDYMYFMNLISGVVKFKGRALMTAKLGKHEIRDSLHIIPESLRNANRKTEIDYGLMHRNLRDKHRDVITSYCIDDCIATFEIVRAFIDKFGMPLTIGQAAMAELKKHYSFKRLSEPLDRYFRQWFFGGRVECLAKAGYYKGRYKLYDVNSMYPDAMAHQRHPIGDEFLVNDYVSGRTAFIHLWCENRGALVSRLKSGELTTSVERGEFYTTIHEYKMARELGLIRDPRIIKTIDFSEWSTFFQFVMPIYQKREELKDLLEAVPDHPNRKAIEQDIKFYKYLLNNAYGKFAQNPRNFKEFYLTAPGEHPPQDWLYYGADIQAQRMRDEIPHDDLTERLDYVKRLRSLPNEETENYWIWSIPSIQWRFNNVATAASITGAARAKLMRARHFAVDALYCDTDSLVCRELLEHEIHPSKLGTWKCETEISEFIMAGKKLYGYKTPDGKEKIRAKGQNGVTWDDLRALIGGATIRKTMNAPTLTRTGTQNYMTRELRMTA